MKVGGGSVEIVGVAEGRARKTARRRGRHRCDQGRRGAGEFLFRTCKEQGEWYILPFEKDEEDECVASVHAGGRGT